MTDKDSRSPSIAGVAAVILAGGEGSRLGGAIKALLEVGGHTLLDRVMERLGAEASPILVAHGRIDPAVLQLPPGLLAVADLEGDVRGPLAGLAAAVAQLSTRRQAPEFLVSAAVDTPFLPHDFVSRLVAAAQASGTAAVLATSDGQDYPTNALWRLDALTTLPQRVGNGTAPRGLKGLAAELGALRAAWQAGPEGDPFANANTPAELAALRLRAAQFPEAGAD
ncbi:MAG: NTP transferase domain-containing protein [Devosia sp.]|nr:NTP transferase domain-containing protein [Devosia sp.]